MWIEIAAQAARVADKVDPGWTWTATLQLASIIIGAPIGGGLIWTTSKAVALQIDKKNETKKLENDAAAIVRDEMMGIVDRLQKRVDDLERDNRDDRKRFDDEVTILRKAHADEVSEMRKGHEIEIRGLREEIAGYHRQMVQWQRTSGAAVELGKKAPTSAAKQIEASGIGDVLRSAFEIPDATDR